MTHPLTIPSFLDRRGLSATRAPDPEAAGARDRAASPDDASPSLNLGPAADVAGPAFPRKDDDTMARGRKNGAGRALDPKQDFGEDPQREASNAKARQAIIKQACHDIAALEAERKKIGESISEIRQTKIKGDLGMKLADFGAIYRLYKLEGDDRTAAIDTLREGFKALGIGEQLDFIDAMQPSTPEAGLPGGDIAH